MNRRIITALTVCALAGTTIFTGCGSEASTGSQAVGQISLRVNPEIEISYDEDSQVTDVTGVNEDGETVVESYEDYEGKDCSEVIAELVEKIHEGGFFEEKVDGNEKNIVLHLQPGSELPEEGFMDELSENVEETVEDLDMNSGVITIDDDDYDETDEKDSHRLSMDKVKEIALKQADIPADDAEFEAEEAVTEEAETEEATEEATEEEITDAEAEVEDDVVELKFTARGKKFRYNIDAHTGKVIDAERVDIDKDAAEEDTAVEEDAADEDAAVEEETTETEEETEKPARPKRGGKHDKKNTSDDTAADEEASDDTVTEDSAEAEDEEDTSDEAVTEETTEATEAEDEETEEKPVSKKTGKRRAARRTTKTETVAEETISEETTEAATEASAE